MTIQASAASQAPAVFVARQPILDTAASTYGSDLLYRSGLAAIGVRRQVTGLWEAMMLLGSERTKPWLSIAILADIGCEHPPELLRISTTRASFCEQLGAPAGLNTYPDDLFLLGLFSLVDAFLGRPLANLLDELPLADGIRRALEFSRQVSAAT